MDLSLFAATPVLVIELSFLLIAARSYDRSQNVKKIKIINYRPDRPYRNS